MATLEATGIEKRFPPFPPVLSGVDLSVAPGEVVLIGGRSGTGKSTLINILAGLEVPTTGTVRVAGKLLSHPDREARARVRLTHVGIIFQHFNLLPDLSVLDNVALPVRLAHGRGSVERARQLLDVFGMGHRAAAYPATLSGGEMQRVAIARALANAPALVLADEPTASLDEDNARTVLETLQWIAHDEARAVVIASHDPVARPYADVCHTIRDGRLVREGEVEALTAELPRTGAATPEGPGSAEPQGL